MSVNSLEEWVAEAVPHCHWVGFPCENRPEWSGNLCFYHSVVRSSRLLDVCKVAPGRTWFCTAKLEPGGTYIHADVRAWWKGQGGMGWCGHHLADHLGCSLEELMTLTARVVLWP